MKRCKMDPLTTCVSNSKYEFWQNERLCGKYTSTKMDVVKLFIPHVTSADYIQRKMLTSNPHCLMTFI